ncbi:hypothetical protein [Allorhodopirellula heiligendammensis]|uniref:Uncharacterized protein n=1 Tax=Allorhodopirellula heiligendammensis TaxID=2714739 RepID=A0A5C6C0P5_9BACT|nr:hypothetical protein [Allorhodopirellula heiligendammensis]TWU17086.1 hypothetical protein Poly21_42960 [Allorhodopirellula heiligendammensis]
MFKPNRFSLLLLLLLPTLAIEAQETRAVETAEQEVTIVVDELENAIQGKSHRPLEEIVTEDATFQGMRPLRKMLRDAKPIKFAPDSRRYWLKLSEIEPNSKLSQYIPEGVDADESVLVFRNTDQRDDRRFRVFYWLTKTEGKWMVVYNADGWDSADPLASAAQELSADMVKRNGVTKP